MRGEFIGVWSAAWREIWLRGPARCDEPGATSGFKQRRPLIYFDVRT